MLQGKRIVVAVTGSIAAYKAAYLVRLLIKEGCEIRVLMTPAARAFVSPLTFSTLSRKPVFSDIIEGEEWTNHVELGLWADAFVIAPATANTLARCAQGISDSLIVATYLSARCPVFVAPAMDLDMWAHPATERNLSQLRTDGVHVIPVGHGELASGLTGDGRMAEPEDIVSFLKQHFGASNTFAGKHVLVTAGPTHEAIDPVRFIGNPSTGKMGIAIAEAFERRGAKVSLVLGPVSIRPAGNVEVIPVQTADQMYTAASDIFPSCDIAILAAAVSDYAPVRVSETKIKKEDGPETLELRRTKDIALELGKLKTEKQVIVGFALETDHAEEHAKDKLAKKNFDFIVLNSLRDNGAGFGHDTNVVTFIFPGDTMQTFGLKSKTDVAEDICDTVAQLL